MPKKFKKPVTGIGDVIESITETVGIKKCQGCENRKQWLNKHFPFNKPNILTPEQIERIETEPLQVYNEAFNTNKTEDRFVDNVKAAILKKLNKLAEYED